MTIRAFRAEDAAACSALLHSQPEFLGDLYSPEELVEVSAHGSYLVIEEDGTPVAIGGLVDLRNGIGMVSTMCVGSAHQGKSYGTQLLQAIKKLAHEKGFRKILSLIHEKNTPMMNLSIKEGFVKEGTLAKHFRDGVSSVVYFSYFVPD